MRRNYALSNAWCRDRINAILAGDEKSIEDLSIQASFNAGFSERDLEFWFNRAGDKKVSLINAIHRRMDSIAKINIRGQKNNGLLNKHDVEHRKELSRQVSDIRSVVQNWTRLQELISAEQDRRNPAPVETKVEVIQETPVETEAAPEAAKAVVKSRNSVKRAPAKPRCEVTLNSFEELYVSYNMARA